MLSPEIFDKMASYKTLRTENQDLQLLFFNNDALCRRQSKNRYVLFPRKFIKSFFLQYMRGKSIIVKYHDTSWYDLIPEIFGCRYFRFHAIHIDGEVTYFFSLTKRQCVWHRAFDDLCVEVPECLLYLLVHVFVGAEISVDTHFYFFFRNKFFYQP